VPKNSHRKIAYIMSRFPHLPETFILREINELDRLGWHIVLYPLILQTQGVIHPEAKTWISKAHYSPFLSINVIAENIRILFQRPKIYLALMVRSLWENRKSLAFLFRTCTLFPKSVYTANLMLKEEIQHIHVHFATHPAFVAWVIHRLTGISYSVTVHAHDIFVQKAMLKTKLQATSFIAAISEFNRDYIAKDVGSDLKNKTHVIRCGIDPSKYIPFTNRNGREDQLEIISIGSLQPYKGQKYLIQACLLLRERNIPFRCRIIGEGNERSMLEALIVKFNLGESVKLLGPKKQEEVADLLPSAHCYVQPSIVTSSGKMEGIPVALMEALSCALPVIATNISGIPELVISDLTGYLISPKDSSALADVLVEIYKYPERAARFGVAGRQLVLDNFQLSTNVAQLAAHFDQLVPNY